MRYNDARSLNQIRIFNLCKIRESTDDPRNKDKVQPPPLGQTDHCEDHQEFDFDCIDCLDALVAHRRRVRR